MECNSASCSRHTCDHAGGSAEALHAAIASCEASQRTASWGGVPKRGVNWQLDRSFSKHLMRIDTARLPWCLPKLAGCRVDYVAPSCTESIKHNDRVSLWQMKGFDIDQACIES